MKKSSLRALLTFAAISLASWQTTTFANSDVADAWIDKDYTFSQNSTANPVADTNGYHLEAGVDGVSGGSVSSASVTPPGGSSTALNNNGGGSFHYKTNSYPSLAAFNAAYPNGSYAFAIQTPDGLYSPSVTISGDNFPITPKLLNTNWSNGALQLDSSQSFTFNWNTFTGFDPNNSEVNFQIQDSSGSSVVFQVYFNPQTSFFLPAGTLQPGQQYKAFIDFGNNQNDVNDNGTALGAEYITSTKFTIDTVPEPGVVALLCIGAIGVALLARSRRCAAV